MPLEMYTVLVPVNYNDGSVIPDAIQLNLQNIMLRLFQGFTRDAECVGGWQDPTTGRTMVEPMVPYRIAVDPTRGSAYNRIVAFAVICGVDTQQAAIHIRLPGGFAENITIPPSD